MYAFYNTFVNWELFLVSFFIYLLDTLSFIEALLAMLKTCNMSDQLGLFVRNDFSAADDSVDKVLSHLERGVMAAFEFVIAVVVAFEIVKSDCWIFIIVFAVRDPRGNKLIVLG